MNGAKFIKERPVKGFFFTFVPSVENLWEFVGSFEVEKRSHGKDQEQTEEKCPQNQGGGDFWAPWK